MSIITELGVTEPVLHTQERMQTNTPASSQKQEDSALAAANVPAVSSFAELGVPESILRALERMQFTSPTPIQKQAIPAALAGKDVLGSAQTGTGKTGAFGIPLASYLMQNPRATALVLTPVRELAEQVLVALRQMLGGARSDVKDALLIGGEPIGKQFSQLRHMPRLIVGTPGRVYDHLMRRSLSLQDTGFLALDETDRMLDMGFEEQLEAIAEYLPKQRQTLMFSATMGTRVVKIAAKYTNNPERISAGPANVAAPLVKQENISLSEPDKFRALLDQLAIHDGSFIVFVNTKRGAEDLSYRLRGEGHENEALHGDLRQFQRQKALKAFRRGVKRVLVATDVASRGLDIPEVACVVNYELPMRAEDYIHRIGRTGRAGAEGKAVNFISSRDKEQWRAIDMLLNPGKRPERPAQGAGNPRGGFGGGQKRRFGQSDGRKTGGFGDRSERSFGDRPSGERGFGDRRNDRPSGERGFGDRQNDRPAGERGFGDRQNDRPAGDRGFGGGFPGGDKPRRDARPERPAGDRPRQDRPFGNDKPRREGGFREGGFNDGRPPKRRIAG